MKTVYLIAITSIVLMSFTVQAAEVTRGEYQSEILDLMNQYGDDFDDCFPALPSDFPQLPDEYEELDDRINELALNKWYLRTPPYLSTEIDEIFFTYTTDMDNFAIRIAYIYNEEESEYIIYTVNFYETIDGINSELSHTETLPHGITDASIKEIDICKATPGFVLILMITALLIVVAGKKYYK